MEQLDRKFDLLFITTFLDLKNIYSFLESLTLNKDVMLRVVLIAQNGLSVDLSRYDFNTSVIDVVNIAKQLPISIARNIGIEYAKKHHIDYRYIMFPDDDSTFDASFFTQFNAQIRGNTLLSVRTRQNIEQHYLTLPSTRTKADRKTDYRYAISVNMLVTQPTIEAVRGFDEELGIGCYYGAGEDCDFYIRSSKVAQFEFNDNLYSIHPSQARMEDVLPFDQLMSRYKSYGCGVVYMFCKNSFFMQAATVILRGILGALHCLCHGRFKMSRVYFVSSMTRLISFIRYIFNFSKSWK